MITPRRIVVNGERFTAFLRDRSSWRAHSSMSASVHTPSSSSPFKHVRWANTAMEGFVSSKTSDEQILQWKPFAFKHVRANTATEMCSVQTSLLRKYCYENVQSRLMSRQCKKHLRSNTSDGQILQWKCVLFKQVCCANTATKTCKVV